MFAKCCRANSAARWPPCPSKTAKHALWEMPLKFSLVMNYENKDTQIISIRQVNFLGLDQSWFAHLRGQTEFRSIKNKFEQLNETVNENLSCHRNQEPSTNVLLESNWLYWRVEGLMI